MQFFVNGVLQGTDTTSPYSVNLSSLAAGTYTLMARAIDGQGAQVDSVTRTVIVSDINNPPTVSITSPTTNANYPTAPASFTLSATAGAGEVNGSVLRVEFYVNGTVVNTDTAGPFSFNVSGLANGTYTLTAKAVDQLNAETTSAPITITVGVAPLQGYFIDTDHLNTPRMITDASQQVVWRNDNTEPFGASMPDENPSGLGLFEFPVRFRGTYADRETNLFQNVRRDLDPWGGRYIQSDPVGLKGGSFSTYVHVANNPLMNIDPFGLTVYICSRQVVWYLGGIGNHSYFWNDKTNRCCGRDQGKDPLQSCKEKGPGGGDTCVAVGGSEGKEDSIMSCCQKRANEGTWTPFKNDCHTSLDNCLKDVGLPNPGAPGGRTGSCGSCWLSDVPPPSIDYIAP